MLQFVGPVIASVLYVIVFQKAGFGGPVLALAASPILSVAMFFCAIAVFGYAGMGMLLVTLPLTLLPLIFLAFKSWPPVAAATGGRLEK